MSTEIVKVQNVLQTMDDVERAARAMAGSGFFQDSKQAAQAVVKILAGQELGFGPFASMTGVHIIQNKPTLAANLMAAAVKRTGKYNYRVIEHTDTVCELEFYEDGKPVGKSRFSMEDAKRAGLTANQTWQKYPRNMLFSRALSNGQKWYAPDVFNGATVYTPEELGAEVNEDGNVINGAMPLEVEELHVDSVMPGPMLNPPEEQIDPTSQKAVKWAVDQWNISIAEARNQIMAAVQQGKLTVPMAKSVFKSFVIGSIEKGYAPAANQEVA